MIIQCKSCNKKFSVPDSAISSKGRLVECSSCGNIWTQFPIKEKETKILPQKIKQTPIAKKIKKTKKEKKLSGPQIYSAEYLEKKHGIKISSNTKKNKKEPTVLRSSSMGFYSLFVVFLILIISTLGILHLTKDIIIYNFPFLESYIDYLFETIMNFKVILGEIFSLETIR